jgi:hypothetical protein
LSILLAAGVLGGCTIEQTPQEFIDHRDTSAIERANAEEELRDRLGSAVRALRRHDATGAAAALSPAAELFAFGPGEADAVHGPAELVSVLAAVAEGRVLAMEDLEIDIGARNQVAWFRTELRDGAEGTVVRFSGVFVRFEGEWRLLQGHLSHPLSPVPRRDPRAVADTAVAAE